MHRTHCTPICTHMRNLLYIATMWPIPFVWTFFKKGWKYCSMIGENRQLVTNEPVEVQDCRKITDIFRGIYRIYPNLIKENRRMWTWNRLDLGTLGSQESYLYIFCKRQCGPSQNITLVVFLTYLFQIKQCYKNVVTTRDRWSSHLWHCLKFFYQGILNDIHMCVFTNPHHNHYIR